MSADFSDMIVRHAAFAMNTRFEMVLIGGDEAHLRAAAEEAVAEIESCEDRLSLFKPGSLLSRINLSAATAAVGVDRETFDLLSAAKQLCDQTEGTFDPTIAPLMKHWKLHDSLSSAVSAESLEQAREAVGMHLVDLNEQGLTVRFAHPGVSLDLGGIAKGHALGLAERVLRRAGVRAALLHAGTSSVTAIGAPPGLQGWKIGLAGWRHAGTPGENIISADLEWNQGISQEVTQASSQNTTRCSAPSPPLTTVVLNNESLSVSAPHGRTARVNDDTVTHILDPRTGTPAPAVAFAAAVADDPTVAEALSTGLIVLGRRPKHLPAKYRTILPSDFQALTFCTERFNGV